MTPENHAVYLIMPYKLRFTLLCLFAVRVQLYLSCTNVDGGDISTALLFNRAHAGDGLIMHLEHLHGKAARTYRTLL